MHRHTCMHACLWSEKAHIPVLFLVLFSLLYYWMVLLSLQYNCFALISHSGLAFVLEWFSLQEAQLVTQFGEKTTSLAVSHLWRHFHGLYFSNLDKTLRWEVRKKKWVETHINHQTISLFVSFASFSYFGKLFSHVRAVYLHGIEF